jgi:hypothetical protein
MATTPYSAANDGNPPTEVTSQAPGYCLPTKRGGLALRVLAIAVFLTSCKTASNNYEPVNGTIDAIPGREVGVPVINFPWPPPLASSQVVLPDRFFVASTAGAAGARLSLGEAAEHLNGILQEAGYGAGSYFRIPGGFALAMQLEQTKEDGTPLPGDARWAMKTKVPLDSLASLSRIFEGAPEGFFQVLVFVVTPVEFRDSQNKPSSADAGHWKYSGYSTLPSDVAALPWSKDTHCTVLVYEFVKPSAGEKGWESVAYFADSGRMRAEDHLIRASLWQKFNGRG